MKGWDWAACAQPNGKDTFAVTRLDNDVAMADAGKPQGGYGGRDRLGEVPGRQRLASGQLRTERRPNWTLGVWSAKTELNDREAELFFFFFF